MLKNLLHRIKKPYLISKREKGLLNAKKFYNSLIIWHRFLGFNYRKILLPKSASAILIYQITSLESVLLICSSEEEQMCRLQCLIKLKASPWGNWNFHQRGDRPGAAATKKCLIKPSGKQLSIIGGTGPLNMVVLIGIHCTGHSTTCWANDPESF